MHWLDQISSSVSWLDKNDQIASQSICFLNLSPHWFFVAQKLNGCMIPLIILYDLLSFKEAIFTDYLKMPDIAIEKHEVESIIAYAKFFVDLLNF